VREALLVYRDHVVYQVIQAHVSHTWKDLEIQMEQLIPVISSDHVTQAIEDRKYVVVFPLCLCLAA